MNDRATPPEGERPLLRRTRPASERRAADPNSRSDVHGLRAVPPRTDTRGFAHPGGRACYPRDLAVEVRRLLEEDGAQPPQLEVLAGLFETLWFASLRTEEDQPVTCTIAFLDPARPDSAPGAAADRWRVTRFAQRRPLTVPELVKLARAADPAAASLAVFHDPDGSLYLWGMVDQVVDFQTNDLGFAGEGPSERPGLFQAAVAPAQISIHRRDRLVVSLVHGQLSRRIHDVLHRGHIHGVLEQHVRRFAGGVRAAVGAEAFDGEAARWHEVLRRLWVGTLSRVLLGVQSYGHGGAVLLVEHHGPEGLNVKYELPYGRLLGALRGLGAARIRQSHARDRLWRGYLLTEDREDLPVDLHLEEGLSQTAEARALNEITGCVRFVASLSQVDGCVVLDQDLAVGGFGVEITVREEPAPVFRAGDAEGSAHLLRPVEYDHFGTRHRSVMRYCWRFPGSVGFVVSQDGTVRAVARRGDQLLLWESIHLSDPSPLPAARPAAPPGA